MSEKVRVKWPFLNINICVAHCNDTYCLDNPSSFSVLSSEVLAVLSE